LIVVIFILPEQRSRQISRRPLKPPQAMTLASPERLSIRYDALMANRRNSQSRARNEKRHGA
jgi:hypothetical protein